MEYKIYGGEKTKVRETACSVVASNCQIEGTHNKHHIFWMKPKFLAIVYALILQFLLFSGFLMSLALFFVCFLMGMQVY